MTATSTNKSPKFRQRNPKTARGKYQVIFKATLG
jgi:hypothetical protein